MKKLVVYVTIFVFLFGPTLELSARGRGGGGRGGGGGFSRGGRGISRSGGGANFSRPASRPSTPSFNRPSGGVSLNRPATTPSFNRPSTPTQRPSTRPSTLPGSSNRPSFRSAGTRPSIPGTGNRPSIPGTAARPGLPGDRPSITPGTRPGITPGARPELPGQASRPSIRPDQRPSTLPGRLPGQGDRPSLTPGDRPTTLPGNLPGAGDRPSIRPGGNRPGLPGTGDRPIAGNRPGDRPLTLPGLGAGLANRDRPSTRPGIGDRMKRPDRLPGRLDRDKRRDRLNDRLNDRGDRIDDRRDDITGRRDGRLGDFSDLRDDRWDRWDDRRDRWNNNWNDRYWYHHHWHHGFWPVYRPGYWAGYWWDRYPVLMVFGVTPWAVNRCGWATGYYSYYNPYATPYVIEQSSVYYNYSQPLQVVQSYPQQADDGTTPPPDVSDETISTFDRSMQEFYAGEYETALASVNEALKELPNDAAVHEFRALVLFALGRYDESAATLYAVLSVGPGWDWTTMSSLYPSVDVYTAQLRALEKYRNEHPDETAARFLLAYHYITAGHEDAAAAQYQRIVRLNPKDELSRNLLLSLDPDADVPKPEITEPPKPAVPIQQAQLVGKWTAQRGGNTYVMDLKENGDFTWSYTQSNGEAQTANGVWAVDDEGIIALDMGEDDTMLAQLNLTGGNLDFYMLGDTKGTEPLKFQK